MTKATAKEIEYHNLILAEDDLALAKLFDFYGEKITASLKSWYSKYARQDEVLILEAVNEAFWGYYKNPHTFNPEHSTLKRFLEIAAERDLKNILEREKKYFKKQNLPEDVELEEKYWNSIKKDETLSDSQLIFEESLKLINNELAIYFDNETDICLAKLILTGERETETFSNLLGLEKLTIEEQRAEVKKHKDRIKKVLERNQVELKLKRLIK